MGLLAKLKSKFTERQYARYLSGFAKTNQAFGHKLKALTAHGKLDPKTFMEELMVTLLEADLGYRTAEHICQLFEKETEKYLYLTQKEVFDLLRKVLKEVYGEAKPQIVYNDKGPTVILLVGVNGSGKTSTAAKLAVYFKSLNKKVCLVAADTFRAGAVEQLAQWAKRLAVDIVEGEKGRDPSSVIVDGCRFALKNKSDIVLIDTAGRLQNKRNLMNELAKMHKVIAREIEGAPQNVWLVLDASTGQNGLSQAKLFNESTDLDAVILTKMDGTSKGGIVIAIKNELNLPVIFITLGEKAEDLDFFDLDLYLYSIIEDLENES